MLTADHIDARKRGDELVLKPLDARSRSEAQELAEAYLEAAHSHVGRRREELNEAWKAISTGARQRRVAAGLEKLVDDGCAFDADETLDPTVVRRAIFSRATEVRRTLADARPFDRAAVFAEVARELGREPGDLENALFADLRGEHVLRSAPRLNATSIVEAYELGRAQAVLLRAVRVTCTVKAASPGLMRAFFARMKFHRLLFSVSKDRDNGFTIVIDGPFSMFESVTKYGLRLALVLPALRALDAWSLVAEVRWGKEREPLVFRMSHKDVGERGDAAAEPHVSDEVQALLEGLETLRAGGSPWQPAIATELLDQPGLGICIPDLALRTEAGELVYVEVLGFWSREAVWKRIELAQSGLSARIVFCASARLRVSAAVLDEDTPAALYIYKGKPSARALLERVNHVATTRLSTS